MHNLRFLLFTLSILMFGNISAQNTLISDDPAATVDNSAVLNIHSDSKGLLIPRLDKASRVTMQSPATGLVIFDTTANIFYFFNGTDWEPVHSGDKEFRYSSFFNVIHNNDHVNADFIVGDDRLPNSSAISGEMLFYDKGKSAFRIGTLSNSNAWAPDSIGINSIGMGSNAKAMGDNAVSIGFENTARGDYTTALGYYNIASGNYSTALGYFNQAQGNFSQASGLATVASGQISTTMGNGTEANSKAALAIGQYNVGEGNPNDWVDTDPLFEIGNGTNYSERENALTVLKNGDFIVGSHELPNSGNTSSTLLFFDQSKKAFRGGSLFNSNVWAPDSIGTNSFAFGANAKANGDYSISLGNYTEAIGESSIAMGESTKAIGKTSTAMGNQSKSIGEFSTAMGSNVKAEAQVNTAIGQYNVGGGDPDDWVEIDPLFEIGNGSSDTERENALTILKNGDFILGDHQLPESDPITKTLLFYDQSKGAFRGGGLDDSESWAPNSIGQYSFAYGENAKAKGVNSTAIGISSVASSPNSVAIGRETEALGESSTALGVSTSAIGNYSIAMGLFSDAIGTGSTAMGFSTNANGTYSTSMGKGSSALGTHSTAMGFYTDANGENSISMGMETIATGSNSISMGTETIATGNNSTSMGDHSIALGNQSVAMGSYTKAEAQASVSIGQYNVGGGNPTLWHSSDPLFEIGNGESEATRANAITVLKNGRVGLQTTNPIGLLHLLYDSQNTLSKHHLVLEEIDPDDSSKIKFQNSGNSDSWIVDGLPNENNIELANFDISYSNFLGQLTTAARFKGNGDVNIHGKLGFGILSTPTYKVHLPNSSQDDIGEAIAYAWNTYSDARVKTNVHPTTYGLKEVLALNPVSYYHHSSEFEEGQLVISQDDKAENIGFIAQEVYEIIQEVVNKPDNEDTNLWSMDYEKITPILVKAIQEQQTKIEVLEQKLDETMKLVKKLID